MMVLGLFKKRRQPITVEYVELPSSMVISQVDSLQKLKELDHLEQLWIETSNEVYLISQKGDLAFRYEKSAAQPRIIKVLKLELNPDSFSVKAQLSQPLLFDFAKRQCLFLFETEDAYYIPSDSVVFYCKKTPRRK